MLQLVGTRTPKDALRSIRGGRSSESAHGSGKSCADAHVGSSMNPASNAAALMNGRRMRLTPYSCCPCTAKQEQRPSVAKGILFAHPGV